MGMTRSCIQKTVHPGVKETCMGLTWTCIQETVHPGLKDEAGITSPGCLADAPPVSGEAQGDASEICCGGEDPTQHTHDGPA